MLPGCGRSATGARSTSGAAVPASTAQRNRHCPPLFLEFCVWDSPLAHDLVEPRFWIDRDGTVAVSQAPGLGITLNEDVVECYRVA